MEPRKEYPLDILEYKKEFNETVSQDSDTRFELELHKEYLQFLEQACRSIATLRKKIETD